MPPRLARSSVSTDSPKTVRNKNKKRNLNAYAIASHSAPAKNQLKQHRLGDFLDDRPAPKRRRDSEDDDVAALDEEDVRGAAKRRKAMFDNGDIEEGSDSEGNEWTLGGLAEDDEDSDLDSDEAFGESDEERFEGFTFGGSKSRRKHGDDKKSRRHAEEDTTSDVDLNEGIGSGGNDDADEDDDFGEEGVDLATMLDDNVEDTGQHEAENGTDEEEEDGSESDKEYEDESDGEQDDDEERNARMRDRLEALDGNQRVAKVQRSAQQNTLSVDDLLADLDPSAKKQFAAATKTKKRSERPTTLAAPLPKRQQDRLNREVASQKAKEQLDRWRDTVIQNRRAEFLSFPLRNPDQGEPVGKNKFSESKPQNELEANIQRIMEESGMASKDGQDGAEDEEDAIMKAEGMAAQKMDIDEVMRRRAELRKARELLFREERKAKRISKIKSKSYRRVHRREKAKEAEREREEREKLGLEPIDEDGREKQDRRRAEERMGTKHRDSKWAKQLKQTNRAAWDEGARDSVNEEARRREELKRRVEGRNVDSEDESDEDPDDDDEIGDGVTLRQLQSLSRGDDHSKQRKGLAGMKFMRDADARRRAQNDEDIERMRKEMAIEDGDEEGSANEIDDHGLGRAIFGPQGRSSTGKEVTAPKAKRPEMEEGSDSEAEHHDDPDGDVDIVTESKGESSEKQRQTLQQANGLESGSAARSKYPHGSSKTPVEEDEEPSWLTKGRASSKKQKSLDDQIHEDHVQPAVSEDNFKEHVGLKAARTDTPAFLQEFQKQAASASKKNAQADAGNTSGRRLIKYASQDNAASDSESTDENPILNPAQQNASLQQRAFAGDEVEAAFRAEKAAQEASEDEQEEPSSHLPGWGNWTGAGLSRSIKKANAAKAKQQHAHHPLFKNKAAIHGVKRENRQDAKLPDVIVSEKGDLKGKKYLAGQLPRGFERKEEYERALRRPVGEEWGTKEVVQRNTRPRVVVQKGTIVAPMERPMV